VPRGSLSGAETQRDGLNGAQGRDEARQAGTDPSLEQRAAGVEPGWPQDYREDQAGSGGLGQRQDAEGHANDDERPAAEAQGARVAAAEPNK